MKPREFTQEEVKSEFVSHIKSLVDYWNKQSDQTTKERLEGLAHSILTTIDGCSHLPSFVLAPDPHWSDKEFNISEGNNYYPENCESSINCDISGSLHEMFYSKN